MEEHDENQIQTIFCRLDFELSHHEDTLHGVFRSTQVRAMCMRVCGCIIFWINFYIIIIYTAINSLMRFWYCLSLYIIQNIFFYSKSNARYEWWFLIQEHLLTHIHQICFITKIDLTFSSLFFVFFGFWCM